MNPSENKMIQLVCLQTVELVSMAVVIDIFGEKM
jgi:hypothetical protein